MKADVYRCLKDHKKTWSIRSRETEDYGIVRTRAEGVKMRNVEFVVQDAGYKKAKEEGIRNVHAFARGRVLYTTEDRELGPFPSSANVVKVRYTMKHPFFTDGRQLRKIESAECATFYPDGECIALGPETSLIQ
jgi:hypothetical protein